ncbi:MAG: tRNA (adenosine(37)-N6)-threonylcarbamoyltransferase complex ATPase subunit type 1 TsaE [Alphaproteobacteria bacterium]
MLLKTEQDTINFAKKMTKEIKSPAVIALRGDLGSGKTTFVRGFIQALCGDIPVPSPTFTLMQEYDSPKGKIVHVDLYRIENPEEIQELGLEDFFDSAIVFIEWPEKAELPNNRLSLFFKRTEKGLEITQ